MNLVGFCIFTLCFYPYTDLVNVIWVKCLEHAHLNAFSENRAIRFCGLGMRLECMVHMLESYLRQLCEKITVALHCLVSLHDHIYSVNRVAVP